jgi:hypothetical protein
MPPLWQRKGASAGFGLFSRYVAEELTRQSSRNLAAHDAHLFAGGVAATLPDFHALVDALKDHEIPAT